MEGEGFLIEFRNLKVKELLIGSLAAETVYRVSKLIRGRCWRNLPKGAERAPMSCRRNDVATGQLLPSETEGDLVATWAARPGTMQLVGFRMVLSWVRIFCWPAK